MRVVLSSQIVGLLIGIGLAAIASRVSATLLFGVRSLDAVGLVLTTGVLATVLVLAAVTPTWRMVSRAARLGA
jgi:BioD-like phosphotransacetylase family protein